MCSSENDVEILDNDDAIEPITTMLHQLENQIRTEKRIWIVSSFKKPTESSHRLFEVFLPALDNLKKLEF